MEKYRKSVPEHDDVILAIDYAEERGEMRGIEIGEKRGIETERNRLVRSFYARNMSIEEIAELMGITVKQAFDGLKINTEIQS